MAAICKVTFLLAVFAVVLALSWAAPADKQADVEQLQVESEPKDLKTANSYGLGYGYPYGAYGGLYGYPYYGYGLGYGYGYAHYPRYYYGGYYGYPFYG
ncbi:hypothetical protein LSTR_LSTR012176 [Laodelphax striatellus]|uniref:Uncharacterized protein n=1 Tax=Laodelphax striatellus TaxID=195883 RepID=A0A482WXX7_LAOST|nr:hypothetical protein LSTR_LSTR012176 [Laodelphax striatellus]